MNFFKRGLGAEERLIVFSLLERGQLLVAWGQLAMEVWNNGLEAASTAFTAGNEVDVLSLGLLGDEQRVTEFLLPAAERQAEIAQKMRADFYSWLQTLGAGEEDSLVGKKEAAALVARLDGWLGALVAKALTRREALLDWDTDPPQQASYMRSMDEPEIEAMVAANRAILTLKAVARINDIEWLRLTHRQFNAVRMEIDQPPLTSEEFGERYLAGLASQRVRYFS